MSREVKDRSLRFSERMLRGNVGGQILSATCEAQMKVRELTVLLQELPEQDAIVVIGDGFRPQVWLPITGLVRRHISSVENGLDAIGPGDKVGIEIV